MPCNGYMYKVYVRIENNMAKNKGLSFYKRKKKISSSTLKELFSWLFGIVVAIFMAVVVILFLGMKINVVGVSMEPTLYNGQKVLINRFVFIISSPKRGDVVAFLPNGNENSHYYVKRVVAVPGDKVLISEGLLFVNGQESKYISDKIMDAGMAANEFVLKKGEYFCIGDNPNNSEDSRSANIGPVKEDDMIGEVWFRLSYENQQFGIVQ